MTGERAAREGGARATGATLFFGKSNGGFHVTESVYCRRKDVTCARAVWRTRHAGMWAPSLLRLRPVTPTKKKNSSPTNRFVFCVACFSCKIAVSWSDFFFSLWSWNRILDERYLGLYIVPCWGKILPFVSVQLICSENNCSRRRACHLPEIVSYTSILFYCYFIFFYWSLYDRLFPIKDLTGLGKTVDFASIYHLII